MDGVWMGRKETQLVGVLRKEVSRPVASAPSNGSRGFVPIQKKTKFIKKKTKKQKKTGLQLLLLFCFSTERRRNAYHLYRMAIAIGERENILSRLPPCRDGSPSSKEQEKRE